MTTPNPSTFPGGPLEPRAGGGTRAARAREVSARSPAVPTRRSAACRGSASEAGGRDTRGAAGPHVPANGESEPCGASSPLPHPASGLGPLPPGSPGQHGKGTRRAPHREEAKRLLRPHSRLPARGHRGPAPFPRVRVRWEPASVWERLATGRPLWRASIPFYSALPASRSLSSFQRQPPVARSTCFLSGSWPALQRATARGRRHPVPKPNQKYGM